MKILLVDDNPDVREITRGILEDRGHEVTAVGGGRAALEALRTAAEPFELLLTDVQMPEMTGTQLLERVLQRSEPAPALLAFSSTGLDERLQSLVRQERVQFLAKPFAATQLDDAVQKAVHLHRRAPAEPVSLPSPEMTEEAAEGTSAEIAAALPRHRSSKWVAAAACLLLTAGLALWLAPHIAPSLPARTGDSVARGGLLGGLAPVGDVAEAPAEFTWEQRESAHSYRLTLSDVDGEELWQATVPAPPLRPAPLGGPSLHRAVVYLWKVEALDEQLRTVAQSADARFRISLSGETELPSTDFSSSQGG